MEPLVRGAAREERPLRPGGVVRPVDEHVNKGEAGLSERVGAKLFYRNPGIDDRGKAPASRALEKGPQAPRLQKRLAPAYRATLYPGPAGYVDKGPRARQLFFGV